MNFDKFIFLRGLSMTNTAMLPLDGERAVTFRDKGQQFTYYFNRISDADYRNRYFPGLSVSSENAGGTMLTRVDVWTPAEYLFAAAIARVEGYKLRPVDGNDGSGDLMQLADWKDKLPHGHRQKAMDILLDVTAQKPSPARSTSTRTARRSAWTPSGASTWTRVTCAPIAGTAAWRTASGRHRPSTRASTTAPPASRA
jgi:hypothetical protein